MTLEFEKLFVLQNFELLFNPTSTGLFLHPICTGRWAKLPPHLKTFFHRCEVALSYLEVASTVEKRNFLRHDDLINAF